MSSDEASPAASPKQGQKRISTMAKIKTTRMSKSGRTLLQAPSVQQFVQAGGIVTCLICTNKVTNGDHCGFCGSTEFKFVEPEAMPKRPNTIKAGFLIKEGGGYKSWLERYFILFEDGVLGYYTSDKMEVKQLFEKRGKLKVKGSKLQDFERGAVIQRDGYLFGLTSAAAHARLYIMEARTFEEREEWMNILVQNGAIYSGVKEIEKIVPESLKEGVMTKQGGKFKSWRRRYFILTPKPRCELQYYKPEEVTRKFDVPEPRPSSHDVDGKQKFPDVLAREVTEWTKREQARVAAREEEKKKIFRVQGTIPLSAASIVERDSKAYTFAVRSTADGRRYLITAYDARERDAWIAAISSAIGKEPPIPASPVGQVVHSQSVSMSAGEYKLGAPAVGGAGAGAAGAGAAGAGAGAGAGSSPPAAAAAPVAVAAGAAPSAGAGQASPQLGAATPSGDVDGMPAFHEDAPTFS